MQTKLLLFKSHVPAFPQVAETCQLAVRRLEWLQTAGVKELDGSGSTDQNPYQSVDPAPPAVTKSVSELRSILLDEHLPLFERYRAMFALRNLGTEMAVLALGDGRIRFTVSYWHQHICLYICLLLDIYMSNSV